MSAAALRFQDSFGVALGFAATVLMLGLPASGPMILLATAGLAALWVVWRDAVSFTIPNGATFAIALAGTASRFLGAADIGQTLVGLLSDVAMTGGVLWLLREIYFRRRGRDGLGLGDVKLAAAAGCLIGAHGFALAMLCASVSGLAFALLKRSAPSDRIAFGVLLAPAVWLTLAAETASPGLLSR